MALFHTIPVPLLVHEYTSTRVHQYLEYRFLPSSWLSEGIHYPTPLVSQCVPALILPSILIRPSQYLPTLLPPSLSQGKARAGQLDGGGRTGGERGWRSIIPLRYPIAASSCASLPSWVARGRLSTTWWGSIPCCSIPACHSAPRTSVVPNEGTHTVPEGGRGEGEGG